MTYPYPESIPEAARMSTGNGILWAIECLKAGKRVRRIGLPESYQIESGAIVVGFDHMFSLGWSALVATDWVIDTRVQLKDLSSGDSFRRDNGKVGIRYQLVLDSDYYCLVEGIIVMIRQEILVEKING